MQWELTDGTFSIQQIRQDGVTAQIPGSKLLIFVNEREEITGGVLRCCVAAYKHWYYKNNFTKSMGWHSNVKGMGVPMMKMPVGYTESDEAKAVKAMRNLRANEDAYLIIPARYGRGLWRWTVKDHVTLKSQSVTTTKKYYSACLHSFGTGSIINRWKSCIVRRPQWHIFESTRGDSKQPYIRNK